MSVIDLGDVSAVPAEAEGYPGGRPDFGRIRVGRLAKIAIAVLAALMLGGSGLAEPPVLRQVWSVPSSSPESMTIDSDAVYLHHPNGTGTTLTAYDLRTGTVRWRRDADTGPAWLGVTPRHGVLLLSGEEQAVDVKSPGGGIVSFSYAGSTTALDPATGRQLWKRPGEYHWEDTGDTVLMSERAGDGTITRLRQVRVGDGSTVWERRAPERADTLVVQFDGGVPVRVVTATARGALTVLRYADGALVASGSVPWRPRSSDTGAGSNLSAVTGRLVVVDTGLGVPGDQSRITVYRTDDLVRLWSRDTTGWANVQDCGPLVCLNTALGRFEAVDPETGTDRWDRAGGQFIGPIPGGDRLLIAGVDDTPEQTLVDAATGQVIGPGGSGSVLSMDEAEGTATLLRPLDPSRSAVSRLDIRTGRSTVLGVLPVGDREFCVVQGHRIACSLDDRLVVTTVG
jgi:outer membrane protein assembly factor BamB